MTTAPTGGHARVVATVGRLNEAVRLRQRADGKVRALKQQQIDQGDDKVREWEKQLQENLSAQAKVVELLKLMAASGDDDEEFGEDVYAISPQEKAGRGRPKDLRDYGDRPKLNLQTELIKRLAADARDQARDQIRALVLAESNKTLRKVLSQDPVQIDRISDSLQLAHQSGASVGQTLAVGYTFLMTVLSRGQNRFPLVVDSPANPLDAGRRRRIGEPDSQTCAASLWSRRRPRSWLRRRSRPRRRRS